MISHKELDIPEKVSGRRLTNRGVHLQPFGHHGGWLDRATYWTDLLVSMGISWVVLINDGDSVRQPRDDFNPLSLLLDAGIVPIIREGEIFPRPFTSQDTFLWTVDVYARYGLKPFWIVRNEPFDDREWVKKKVPPGAWEIIMRVWSQGAQFIASHGGLVGFPDGPGYSFNPFESIKAYDCQWIFDQGLGFYTGHHYGKCRPRDYPYDAVTRYGAQLTEEDYGQLLDDYAADPTWGEEPIELMNQRRSDLKSASLTALRDDICWRGWEKVVQWSLESFGYVVPMAMTEGGWVPRDRPGSGPDTDIRMPHTTPRMVAQKTLQMYDAPSPFFAICPWLLADEDMGGVGWPFDAWHGWAYSEKYGRKKPVIVALQQVPPKEVASRSEPLILGVNGDTRDWAWAQQAYGAGYRRGTTPLQLIEIHEYEGPATLDVWVVDEYGLPVEGIEFCYSYPGAPPIPPDLESEGKEEWYSNAVLSKTGPDGRISFPAKGKPGAPGTGQEALWPRGKGDVLEKIGLLAGTNNRHLNGMWQWGAGSAPAQPSQPEQPGEPEQPEQPDPSEDVGGPVWQMALEQRPGARIIAGSFPRSGIQITVSDPWGNATSVTSGSKPEYGPGGFEVVASHPATYTLVFLDQSFAIPVRDGASIVTFTEGASAEPEPEPEPGPGPEPEPEPQPPPAPPAGNWTALFERLDQIEQLIAQLLEK